MDKAEMRVRLGAMSPVRGVLPTGRSSPGSAGELARVATAVWDADIDTAEVMSVVHARNVVRDADVVRDVGLAPLLDTLHEDADDVGVREQLLGFARAGITFFEAGRSYLDSTLPVRRSRGGNGAVTRVLTSGTRIALETTRLIVRFEAGIDQADVGAILRDHHLIPIRRIPFAENTWQVAAEHEFAQVLSLNLMDRDEVVYAEPDFVEHVGTRQPHPIPHDPLIRDQWHHATLGLPQVWPQYDGSGVRVAVVDNGFFAHHSDLTLDPQASGWYRATADLDDADLQVGLTNLPDADHGTACAGMIAARETGQGGVGVAFRSPLHAIACLGDQVGTQSTLARAVAFAADPRTEGASHPGADVVACSLGPNGAVWEMRRILSDAIDFASIQANEGKGVPLFWAVTNGNYPIAADEVNSHPGVISVGRSTQADQDDGTGYGPKLDFLAPGVDVLIPSSTGGYRTITGTSFAAPCAAGVAALILQKEPTLNAEGVRQHLRSTCVKVGSANYDVLGRNDRFGFGRIDAAGAIAALP